MKRFLMMITVGVLWLSACAAGDIEVRQPWARAAMKGENSAVYLELHNHTTQAVAMTGVSSDAAGAAEIHLSSMNAEGVMQMTKQDSVSLDAGAQIDFSPGGLHIMLIGLTRDLKAGDHLQVTLHFQTHADIILDVVVQEMEGMDGHAP